MPPALPGDGYLSMLLSGNVSPLRHALWLRWHRLEFGYANDIGAEYGHCHQHSGGPVLSKVLTQLRIPANAVVVDFGVGMGIAAITLSSHFRHVVGVDLSKALIDAAHRNLRRVAVTNVTLHCGDARDLTTELDAVTHVYMFNPFPDAVMTSVMANLRQSQDRNPRLLTVIYKNPVCHQALIHAGFTHSRCIEPPFSHAFAIYKADNA